MCELYWRGAGFDVCRTGVKRVCVWLDWACAKESELMGLWGVGWSCSSGWRQSVCELGRKRVRVYVLTLAPKQGKAEGYDQARVCESTV